MTHNNHTDSLLNQDLEGKSLQYYIDLIGDYVSPYPDPVVTTHEGVRVVRDDMVTGTKVRGGDLLVSRIPHDTLVYCQPRTGMAGPSLCELAKRHGKRLVLFMPACGKISEHQMVCVERGADVKFARIASMTVLNSYAKKWAEENGAYFIPLGLKHELVTAGIIQAALKIPEPSEVWSVVSTGVLSRALQIAWSNAEFHMVAVARNIKSGERGRASIISAPEPFQKAVKTVDIPPFPSVPTYDAKAWRYIPKNTDRDILMWNVARSPHLLDHTIHEQVHSAREWGDLTDLGSDRRLPKHNEEANLTHVRLGELLV